ncbi:17598_t:CDS:2, partial [Funneliformis geosporum]
YPTSSDHVYFVFLDFHSPGDRKYCDDSVKDPGIRMQDAISHYNHPSRADEDIDEFIKDYRLYLTVANITTANASGKQRALELFRSYLTDEASRWIKDKLIDKKWRLNHVRCGNALATMPL